MIGLGAVLAQLTIAVSAPDTVLLSAPIRVHLVVEAPGRTVPRTITPTFYPLARAGFTQSTLVAYRLSRPWVTVDQLFELRATRPGTYTIGAFEARLGSEVVRSRPARVVVRSAPPRPPPAIIARAPLDSTAGVNFHALLLPDTVYVGQQTTYQVGVFLDDDVRLRLRRNPEFVPPEPRAMMSYDLPTIPGGAPERTAGSRRYEAHVFQRALFPLAAGRFVIPPARLGYSLPLTPGFFSRAENFTLYAESLAVVAVEPPPAGRPGDFAGAVGELTVSARAESTDARVGDPLLLTVRVAGTGNVKLFPRPAVSLPWATAVPAAERVHVDSSTIVVRGSKDFDWIVTPQQAGRVPLAPIRYPYFNPFTERYEVAITAPDSLEIAAGALAQAETAPADTVPVLSLRAVLRAPVPAPYHTRATFWMLALLAPLPAAVIAAVRRPRVAAPRSVAASATLRALGRAKQSTPVDVRRAYVRALTERLGIASRTLASEGELAHQLRLAGVTAATAHEAEDLLHELDRASYSSARAHAAVARRAAALFERVDRESRPVTILPARGLPLAILVLSLASALSLGAGTDAASRFADAVAEYGQRRFAQASVQFLAIAHAEPRSSDAWANYGTASWASGDTVGAVLGWHRALRLEPLAADMRERMVLLPGPDDGGMGAVPLVSANAAALAALVSWLAAWMILAWRAARPAIRVLPAVALALVSAVGFALAAEQIDERMRARSLDVVREGGPLRTLPALSAPGVLPLGRGEIVRALEQRGHWTRVALDDSHEGWLENDRLLALQ